MKNGSQTNNHTNTCTITNWRRKQEGGGLMHNVRAEHLVTGWGGSGNLDWGDQGELPQGSKLLLSSKWTKERLGGGQWQRAVNLSIFLQENRNRPAIRKASRARTPQAREGAHADPPPGMCSPLGPSRVCPWAHCSLTASLSPYLPQSSSLPCSVPDRLVPTLCTCYHTVRYHSVLSQGFKSFLSLR